MMKIPGARDLQQNYHKLSNSRGHRTRRIAIDMVEAAEAQLRSQVTLYHGSREFNRKVDLQALVTNVSL